MPDESDDARRWVVDPPAPGEILFQLTAGEGAELTAEQEAAVYDLMRTLEMGDAEVIGHTTAKCPHLVVCNPKTCPPLSCAVLKCNLTSTGLTGGTSIMGSFGLA